MARNQEKAQALLNKFASFKKKMKYKNKKNLIIEKKKKFYLFEIYKKSKHKMKSLISILQLIHLNTNFEKKKKLLKYFNLEIQNLKNIKKFQPNESNDLYNLSLEYNIQNLFNDTHFNNKFFYKTSITLFNNLSYNYIINLSKTSINMLKISFVKKYTIIYNIILYKQKKMV
ncbi:hypothetical protein M951_chr283 (nucleomorph) [Lotharella oceanica]|uniref:Uncharacterized protein n=2 Tax=Lotharella oceanica TaxID=641309 RepID=A0A060DG71_9EUKA|nr:hypothetical protein M951_chr283 [Lotharella oceanica]